MGGRRTERKAETSKEPKTKPRKSNDHATDALRYGAMTRPVLDTGRYMHDSQQQLDPTIRYATSVHKRDHRDGAAYDDNLGSEW